MATFRFLDLSISGTQTTYRTDVFQKYVNDINRTAKMISKEQEIDLIKAAQNGDMKAESEVINANLKIVISIAKYYKGLARTLTLDDLIAEGNIGLIKAVKKFDTTNGAKFLSYAIHCIRAAILEALNGTNNMIHLPYNKRGISHNVISGDTLSDNEDDKATFFDRCGDDTFKANSFDDRNEIACKLAKALNKLAPRDREIICGLYGIGCRKETLNTLAMKNKLTKERVRQIVVTSLEVMKG